MLQDISTIYRCWWAEFIPSSIVFFCPKILSQACVLSHIDEDGAHETSEYSWRFLSIFGVPQNEAINCFPPAIAAEQTNQLTRMAGTNSMHKIMMPFITFHCGQLCQLQTVQDCEVGMRLSDKTDRCSSFLVVLLSVGLVSKCLYTQILSTWMNLLVCECVWRTISIPSEQKRMVSTERSNPS